MSTPIKDITKSTKIINIGALPSHVDGKTQKLIAAGFTNTVGIITSQTTQEEIKEKLRNSPESLFIVGGAMYKEYPEIMSELNEFISKECPTILVYNTTIADFPPNTPITAEVVAESGVTIANKLLKE